MKTLDQAVEKSLKAKKSTSHEVNFKIEVEGENWSVYEVYITRQEVFCLADEGTATFLVDDYGSRCTYELYDYEKDGK